MTFVGKGYSAKLNNPEEQHTEKPDRKIITKICGPGKHVNYITDAICLGRF